MDLGATKLFAAVLFCMAKNLLSLPTTDGQNSSHLTGKTLVEMGSKLNKPLLRLIGKTLINVEEELKKKDAESSKAEIIEEICRLHPCSEWNEWSRCDATKLGKFGGQRRSRNCGFNTTLCKRYAETSVEYDYRVCEFCPTDYIVGQHGFCLKLYDSDKKKRDDAEAACQSDGGHLVNIDSMEKVHDVNATLSEQSYSADSLWIDGRRTVQGGSWKFGYESADPTFTFWGDNDPDNGPTELCMSYRRGSNTKNYWRKFDSPCSETHHFMCHIIV